MLSMSSDTLESSGSKEWAPVDYGHSRSSTPDSSASSRLAAQLERSAYRRSRSNIQRRHQPNSTSNFDINASKPHRKKPLRNQETNQSSAQVQDDFTKINGSLFVVEGTQKSSTRSTFHSEDDQSRMVSGNNPAMTKSRTTDEQYFKEHQFDELQDGTRTLRAYPISTYTVSQVAVAEENHEEHSLNFVTENSSRKNDTVDVINRRSQSRGGLQNGIYSERRLNGLPPDRLCEPNGSDTHFEARRNGRVSVSRVRFEESWEDTTTSKAEYKGGGDLAKANSSRENTGSNRSKYRLNVCDKSDVELKLTKGINSTTHNVKQWECQDRQKEVSMNSVSPVYDEPENKNDKKDDMTCRYNTTTVKREVYSKLNQGAPQIVPEVSRVDEPKPLGLRQLIKIHEVQIAEVARSAASMRRPTTGKIQEGRLVKVKAVPEIEAKQTHIKQHTGKVSLTGNKASFEESDGVTKPIRIIPSQTDNLNDSKRNQDSGENELLPNSDGTFNLSTTVVKPKRHTVEITRTKPEVREEQKWKRHTAIGLVGVDPQEIRESLGVNAWSSTGKISEKIFAGDSDLESEHTNKQTVEPEKQVVNEKVKKCDVIDVNTSRRNEISELYMSSDEQKAALEYEHEQNDVPPERPPLPENFYSSAEDILERPPPPITDDTDIISAHMLQENVTPSNEIIKPSVSGKRQRGIPSSSSLPAVHAFPIGVDIQREEDNAVKSGNVELEKDVVFGNSRSNREMYEERLARINLVPLDVHQELCTNEDMVSSQCTSPESFAWRNNLYMEKNACSEKLKSYAKQLKLLIKEKEDLERKFELELRDWKRKYEEQQKVANAYQKLEDRYRRRVQELQGALMKCRCSNAEEIKTLLLGQLGKRSDSYFLPTQTQSILDETEEWLKEQSVLSEIIHNSENTSGNARIPNGNSLHGSLSDVTGGAEWDVTYKDIDLATGIDQYNGTSV